MEKNYENMALVCASGGSPPNANIAPTKAFQELMYKNTLVKKFINCQSCEVLELHKSKKEAN